MGLKILVEKSAKLKMKIKITEATGYGRQATGVKCCIMGKFKELKVWQESKDLAVKIYHLTADGELLKDYGLKDQMRRSAVSIPSNIAEGDDLETDKF